MEMSCLACVVDVIVERQHVVGGHTEALYSSCNRNSNTGNCDVDLWFRPLSSPGINDNRSGRQSSVDDCQQRCLHAGSRAVWCLDRQQLSLE